MTGLKGRGSVLGAVAAGGVLGSEARYALSSLQAPGAEFPWLTLVVNASGCLLIGVLMTVVLELTARRRLVRPFLGVGLLGGYTTFSTYAVDVHQMLVDGRYAVAATYLAATPVTALAAVWTGAALTRAGLRRRKLGGGGS